jgi:hypothetical protein
MRFVLDQQVLLEFDSGSTLKQQFIGRHVAPLGHVILILRQPIVVLTL